VEQPFVEAFPYLRCFHHKACARNAQYRQQWYKRRRHQFLFIDRYVPPKFGEVTLTSEEQEEQRKREEHKDRLNQNYLKRKANGK